MFILPSSDSFSYPSSLHLSLSLYLFIYLCVSVSLHHYSFQDLSFFVSFLWRFLIFHFISVILSHSLSFSLSFFLSFFIYLSIYLTSLYTFDILPPISLLYTYSPILHHFFLRARCFCLFSIPLSPPLSFSFSSFSSSSHYLLVSFTTNVSPSLRPSLILSPCDLDTLQISICAVCLQSDTVQMKLGESGKRRSWRSAKWYGCGSARCY